MEKSDYDKLMAKFHEIALLNSIGSVLGWDMETYMPSASINLRSEQLAALSAMGHKKITDPQIGKLLDKIGDYQDSQNYNKVQKRNLHLLEKEYTKNIKIPEKLVRDLAKQRSKTNHIWKKAKKQRNFELVKQELKKLFELVKQRAELLADAKGIEHKNMYDALLDEFEPGLTAEKVTKLFNELKDGLIPIVDKCVQSPQQADLSVIKRKTPIELQKRIGKELIDFIGYDMTKGRLDETEHPFTSGYFDDVRITTHYYEDNIASSIYSILHEGGHGLYEMNINPDYKYQPIGTASSYGLHESQSRFVENIVGRSKEFWNFFLPKFKSITGPLYKDVTLDEVYRAVNHVSRSKIRIEADEVTYGLHIIIRFELERDLFAGNLTIEDLPTAWNKKYEEYLGVTIDHDSEGVMQDTHWYSGLFGYFPSYALGNVYNAQMLLSLEEDIPNWRDLIQNGEFGDIKTWLVENVHQKGDKYDPIDLIKQITGETVSVKPFIEYLIKKYADIYGFDE